MLASRPLTPNYRDTTHGGAAGLGVRGMKTWLVGGSVRDRLMGLPEQDRDWVVVGSTPQAMLDAGFKAVGRDFPVFIHPASGEEYALARTERKSGAGYHGFSFHAAPDVTLEQDLARRDLSVNAMAQDPDSGEIVDPYNGQADLAAGVLRHVSLAFAEDPVRLLRVARFAARWPHFRLADETLELLRQLVQSGEVDALVSERVWQELSRGLMAPQPSRLLQVLRDCGALARLAPELDCLWGVPQRAEHHPEVDTGAHLLLVLDMAARLQAPLPVRYAALCHDLGKGNTPRSEWPRHIGHEQRSARLAHALSQRWRVPQDCAELADLAAREHVHVHASGTLKAAALLRLLERCDAWRRPERVRQMLLVCECDMRGRGGMAEKAYPQRERLEHALEAALAADVATAAQQALARGLDGQAVGAAVRAERLRALARFLGEDEPAPA